LKNRQQKETLPVSTSNEVEKPQERKEKNFIKENLKKVVFD
jgi:hypothetical protein